MTQALNLEGIHLPTVAQCTTVKKAGELSNDADIRGRTIAVWRAFERADAAMKKKGFPDSILKAFRNAGYCLGWAPEKDFSTVSIGKADDVDMRWFTIDRMEDGSAVQHFRAPGLNGGVGVALRVKGRDLNDEISDADTQYPTPIRNLRGLVVFLQVGDNWVYGNSFALTAAMAIKHLHPAGKHEGDSATFCDNCPKFHRLDPGEVHKAAFIEGLLLGRDPAFLLEGLVDQDPPTLPAEAAEPEEKNQRIQDDEEKQPLPDGEASEGCWAWFCGLFSSCWAYFFGD